MYCSTTSPPASRPGAAPLSSRLRFVAASAALCLAAAVGSCARDGASPVIVTINGETIHLAEFEAFLASRMGEFGVSEATDIIRSEMLDEFIRRRLLVREAKRAGVSIDDSEIDQAAEENPEKRSRASEPAARKELADDLLVDKYCRQVLLRDVNVTPEEAQQYVEENKARLSEKPAVWVREIRVQSREEADRLRREIVEGSLDFAAAVRNYSDTPGSEEGGLTRYEEGQLPSVLNRPVMQLRPGDISPVIQTGFGFHIFKLERRLERALPDARRAQVDERRTLLLDELIARKNQQALDDAISRILSSTTITIHVDALGFTYAGHLRQN